MPRVAALLLPNTSGIVMAIYHKFGSPVEIAGYCGKHKPQWANVPLMLVKVKYLDDGSEGYQFATNLRAEGGINEIDAAVTAAPDLELTGNDLRAAIKTAE